MKTLTLTLLAGTLLFLTSCATSRHPVGLPLDEDLSADLTGMWTNPERSIHIHCDEKGSLQWATQEWNEDDGEFKIDIVKGPIRKLNDDFYVVNLSDAEESENYTFILMSLENGKAICWASDYSSIRELIEDKTLPGDLTDHGAVLTGDGEEIAKKLSAKPSEAFDWETPSVFWKSTER